MARALAAGGANRRLSRASTHITSALVALTANGVWCSAKPHTSGKVAAAPTATNNTAQAMSAAMLSRERGSAIDGSTALILPTSGTALPIARGRPLVEVRG